MFRFFRTVAHHERTILFCCIVLFLISFGVLLRKFYVENTTLVPSRGGTYIEGSVGELQPLIPWFTVTNDVNRDIVSLVFAGLQKYNPETKKIEDDLGVLQVSETNKVYTVRLHENIEWHDSTPEDPHLVTADDVLFTFQSIQNQDFPNSLLRQNFLGVTIEKVDERTVKFILEKPYRFFASNLTLGLLPKRSFEGVPVAKFDQVLDYGFEPIGAGPYAFKGLVQTDLSVEITLERFARPLEPFYHLERVVFRVFPDYNTLLSDIRTLDGVRLVPRNDTGEPIVPRSFRATNYTLPQYVALFFNLDKEILADKKLRLGLQLGTDKQALVDRVKELVITDTPLLEINTEDWRYQYDPLSAQGALFNSDWHLPEKVRLQRLLEMRESNTVGPLHVEPIVYIDTGASLILTGALLDVQLGSTINGIPIQASSTGTWVSALPTHGGTGSIQLGYNLLRLSDKKGKVIDSAYVWRTTKSKDYKAASLEQQLLEQFVASRSEALPPEERITVANLYLEKGFLRRKLSTDPTDIRINDKGERLSLRLVTSKQPPQYEEIAKEIQQQWAQLGVHVGIEIPETRAEFEKKLINRDYDILLYGQSLLDNLDSYPYWHGSGVQHFTGKRSDLRIDAYNLSQYASLEADTLLEVIRETGSSDEQKQALSDLREVLKKDVPAIFLYSPLYTFAYNARLQGVRLGTPSLHSDRFLTLHRWYLKEGRQFQSGKSWFSFIPWVFSSALWQ
ncbi:hypothetical protein COU76_02240 [Candidatus Peregrinibacteria bacterium CG10_big_fil_rev_8_21_14_0_10_49_10]|nr:MAG: hypothetical protein COU76_02240 [Candidatus Peregrinibacteria bacterium CG10_big_fil_rev_8_21_14_0_10_49_10]